MKAERNQRAPDVGEQALLHGVAPEGVVAALAGGLVMGNPGSELLATPEDVVMRETLQAVVGVVLTVLGGHVSRCLAGNGGGEAPLYPSLTSLFSPESRSDSLPSEWKRNRGEW